MSGGAENRQSTYAPGQWSPEPVLSSLDTNPIHDVLAQLRDRERRFTALAVAAQGLLGLTASVALALLLAQSGLTRFAAVVLLAGTLASLTSTAARIVRLWRRRDRALAAAGLAEHLAPELGTAATAAVDLSRQLAAPAVRFSRDLAAAHVENTATALTQLDLVHRYDDASRPKRRLAVLMTSGAVVVVGLLALALPSGRARLASLLLHGEPAQLVDMPLAADIRITYHFPAYTGLTPRVVEGGDGSIAALVGTEVEVAATADTDVRRAFLKVETLEGNTVQEVPMQVTGDRKLQARFPVSRDGRYHFALVTGDGERLEERVRHAIRAVPDAYPEVVLESPADDVELRDNQAVQIAYHAKDDFAVNEVVLVVEVPGSEPKRIALAGPDKAGPQIEDTLRWSVADLGLPEGAEGRFYLEATDNDTISGPKHATSATRRLVIFSAAKHHAEMLARQQKILDGLVDTLGADVVAPPAGPGAKAAPDKSPTGGPSGPPAPAASGSNGADGTGAAAAGTRDPLAGSQRRVVEMLGGLAKDLADLVAALREDKLTAPEVATAFTNIHEHVARAERDRNSLIGRLVASVNRPAALVDALAKEQRRAIAQLEKDIIYLDDLLAMQRIDELKRTAKDLLAAQRDLQQLLERYRETQDPALRAELEKKIRALKDQMLGLLARMAEIKQSLPGEYKNIESAQQLAIDDQLQRLEDNLAKGDLDAAAKELEELASLIDNMSQRLDRAQEEYGGERYAALRQQLNEFAEQLKRIEGEQQALAKRTDDLLDAMRKKAIEQAGQSLDRIVEEARAKTREALAELDKVARTEGLWGTEENLEGSRQRLLDLDGLLAQKDFSESLKVAQQALEYESLLRGSLQANAARYGSGGTRAPEFEDAARATNKASERTGEVVEMLSKLFPDPSEALTKEQQRQLQNMGKKQAELEREAGKLGQKMDELAKELPLFGGEPRAELESARSEMGQAQNDIDGGELPGGAQHSERAASELAKLRQGLEQAAKGQRGGLPLPLGMPGGPGGQEGDGGFDPSVKDVHIPDTDKRGDPRFRKDLLEAAKQRPPERYEDAVRRYYEELIR